MDAALWYAGILMEAAFLGLLLYRRAYRLLPMFCTYAVWAFCSDAAMIVIRSRYPDHFLRVFLVQMAIDAVLQFGVLVELAWSILRPVRNALPRGAIVGVAFLVLIAAAIIWPFAGLSEIKNLTREWLLLMRLQQTVSILRVVFFVVIAASSQVLALGWRNRELQVATGLGFYSLAGLGAAMMHAHQATTTRYHYVDQFVAACYLCSLVYWTVSFAQTEAPRQEFSPRMQSFLLSMAGVARTNRIALTSPSVNSSSDKPKR